VKVEKLTAEHCMALGNLEPVFSPITADVAVELEALGGWAAVDGDVLAIAGILPRWEGVGLGWAWLSRGWRKHARLITETVRIGLEDAPYHRIETGVKHGYGRGERWAEMLGFVMETPLARKWGPDGSDYSIWARVK
jgi:hypothetical protein